MRLVLAALMIITVLSFYFGDIGDFLNLSYNSQMRVYQLGIFLAAVLGGYGVVLSVFGLILPARHSDHSVRILPLLFMILGAIALFFYLLVGFFTPTSERPGRDRVRPGETITI